MATDALYDSEMLEIMRALKERLPCCVNCVHFHAVSEHCTFNNANARPPAKVIAFGCPAFTYDIPF